MTDDRADKDQEVSGAAQGDVMDAAEQSRFGEIGQRLAEARQDTGYSQAEAAEALNLLPRVIEALEEEDFDALPGRAFARGYLRSYARLLDLSDDDLEPALEALRDTPEAGPRPVSNLSPRGSNVLDSGPPKGLLVAGIVLLVLVLILIIGAILWPGDASLGADDAEAMGATEAPGEALPESVAQTGSTTGDNLAHRSMIDTGSLPVVSYVVVPTIPLRGLEQAVASEVAELEPSTTEAPLPETAALEPRTDTQVAASADTAMAAAVSQKPEAWRPQLERETTADGSQRLLIRSPGDDRLELSFSADSWVEVWDASDRELHRDLRRADQLLDIRGQAPFRILVGNAPGVSVTFNDDAVPLRPHTRNQVASLVVGR